MMSSNGIVDRSTLTLLEHVNLNVPSHEDTLPFYFDVLGCGLDPRKAENLKANAPTKTIWANCGASQFHLPHGETAQRIPGTIALRFRPGDRWHAFRERVNTNAAQQQQQKAATFSCVKKVESGTDRSGREFVQLTDQYDNVFLCRPETTQTSISSISSSISSSSSSSSTMRQPIVGPNDTERWGAVAEKYGREDTDCTGIDFVEFKCPRQTAEKIALFYDSVFDATTSVIQDGDDTVAVVAFGNVDENGKSEQQLLFRETDEEFPPYDGHHIAMYVGETQQDFEQAFRKAQAAGIVWVNPRFSDKADSLSGARKWNQFRFKDIIDMETGEMIFELEHEMRSIQHEAWPGKAAS